MPRFFVYQGATQGSPDRGTERRLAAALQCRDPLNLTQLILA